LGCWSIKVLDRFTHSYILLFAAAVFHLPEQQVQILHSVEKLRAGDVVYAVYPDTTSFYQVSLRLGWFPDLCCLLQVFLTSRSSSLPTPQATVVQAPRKQGTGGAFVMLNFLDDSDEFGITHDKAVPLKHVMLPPFGVTIQ
jgi:hypothetical protein